jgi:excisionase family DNA binding protein
VSAPQLLSTAEAGERLGVAGITVWRWVRSGKIPAIDIGSPGQPRLRIREDDLQQFIEDRTLDIPA